MKPRRTLQGDLEALEVAVRQMGRDLLAPLRTRQGVADALVTLWFLTFLVLLMGAWFGLITPSPN